MATELGDALTNAATRLQKNEAISVLEWNGMLHALQVLIENAIGKAKHMLKRKGLEPPVSAYDTFYKLLDVGDLSNKEIDIWVKIIGLRNAIVYEYLKVNREIIKSVIVKQEYQFVIDFLKSSFVGGERFIPIPV